jgi:uncharacterized protein
LEWGVSKEYPDWLDPRKAAEGRRRFAGTIPLQRMSRLMPLLAHEDPEANGRVEFSAEFEFDPQSWVIIQIEVKAELALVCQLSLEPYMEKVQRSSTLAAITDMEQEKEIPEHYEPVLLENGRLALQDLVEDELLLGLPQVPRNPQIDAASYQVRESESEREKEQDERVRQPFADLAEKLKNHAKDQKKRR